MDDMDWKAASASEIFREYVKNELIKEAYVQADPVDQEQILEDFDEFQKRVNTSPKLKLAFRALQEKFANDPVYRSKVDPKFADGVMLLNLDSEEI